MLPGISTSGGGISPSSRTGDQGGNSFYGPHFNFSSNHEIGIPVIIVGGVLVSLWLLTRTKRKRR